MNAYKPFTYFLIRFCGVYALLSIIYKWWYLDQFNIQLLEYDGITELVARQVQFLAHLFNLPITMFPSERAPALAVFYNHTLVAQIIEGCNAVSILILFTAFIAAFYSSFKNTLLYLLAGIVIIYVLNLFRILWFVWALYYYPQHRELLHDLIFPLIIYGSVFALWMLWALKFSKSK